jgi:hypothetical protein
VKSVHPIPAVLGPLFGAAVVLCLSAPVRSDPPPAAAGDSLEALMPDDVAGYLKVSRLGDRLDEFLRSPARKDLESIDAVRFVMTQEPWQKLLSGLEDFKAATGKDGLSVFKDLFGGEVLIGVRQEAGGGSPDVVVLARALGAKELDAAIAAVRQSIAAKIGYMLEGYKTPHDDFGIETIGELSFASIGPVLAMSNRLTAIERVIDLSSGKAKGSVKDAPAFARAAGLAGKDDIATLVARPKLLPNFDIPGKLDNPAGSLIAGGFLGALGGSDLIALGLRAGDGGIELRLSTVGGVDGKYASFYPPSAPDPLAGRLEKRGVLALGELHRNLKEWFDRRDDLLVPQAAGQLAGFDGMMSSVFGGKSFRDEVLPAIGSRILIVAQNQIYPGLDRKPVPAIPAFSLVLEMRGAKEFGASLASAFGTLVGLANVQGPNTFLVKTEKVGDVEMQVAAPDKAKDVGTGLIDNFSPSLAVVGSRVVLSSSVELAKAIVEELSGTKGDATAGAKPVPDSLKIDAEAMGAILKQNLDIIVSDSMSKKVISREQAEREANFLLDIVKALRDLRVTSGKEGDTFQMTLTLRHRLGGVKSF